MLYLQNSRKAASGRLFHTRKLLACGFFRAF
nr:MAG TPA: hypothetical protein [Caudoviricetes sp.]